MSQEHAVKRVAIADGKVVLADLTLAQIARLSRYQETLEAAWGSKVANPPMSNYFVRTGISAEEEHAYVAGNIEYGLCGALHGEECATSVLRAAYGRHIAREIPRPVLVAFAAQRGPLKEEDFPQNIPSCCGNCRDVLLENFGTDIEILCGHRDGGLVIVLPFGFYMFSDYRSIEDTMLYSQMFQRRVFKAASEGERIEYDPYSPASVAPRKYSAMLVCGDAQGKYETEFVGAMDVPADYHPVYAIRDAIRAARRYEVGRRIVKEVYVVNRFGFMPEVMYKDRQHLFEFNCESEALLGRDQNPTVYLVAVRNRGEIIEACQTTAKEWLPFPFSLKKFGDEFMAHYRSYVTGR